MTNCHTARSPAQDGLSIPFTLSDLRSTGVLARLTERVLDDPQWLFRLLRDFWPIPHVPFTSWWMVTRYDDVQEVLSQDQIFPVPFGPKVTELNGGINFLLGLQDSHEYWRYHRQVKQAFRLDDVAKVVVPKSFEFAQTVINSSDGRLDAVQDFITRVPTMICQHYYGINIGGPEEMLEFGQWTLAMSTYMFGDPTNKPGYRRAGVSGGARLRQLVDRAIHQVQAAQSADTVLARLVKMQQRGAEGLTDEAIRAIMIGMVTGFVPTNTMAAGNILEMLLRRPDFMAKAQAAAHDGDDIRLKYCLFEAMRFKPLNPGPFRDCYADYTVAACTSRATTIPRGARLLVGTQSAMFDQRRVVRPNDFNPNRPPSDYMLFGFGLHWCVGTFIAEAQITQTLKALLLTKGLRRKAGGAGRLQLAGPFPEHLSVELDR